MLKYLLCLGLLTACQYETDDDMQKAGKTGGWQVSGKLISGNTDGLVHAQADFPKAEYYTILFGVDASTREAVSDPVANGIFDCIADIVWSVEGNDVRRRISVGNGTTISGTGAGVKVDVRDRTSPVVYVGNVGRPYKVNILITPGTRPSQESPPTLMAETDGTLIAPNAVAGNTFFTVPPGQNIVVPIPQNAGVRSVNIVVASTNPAFTAVTPTMFVVLINNGLTGLKSYFPDLDGWIPIPPNAIQIQLVSNVPALGPDLVCVVTFGIEG